MMAPTAASTPGRRARAAPGHKTMATPHVDTRTPRLTTPAATAACSGAMAASSRPTAFASSGTPATTAPNHNLSPKLAFFQARAANSSPSARVTRAFALPPTQDIPSPPAPSVAAVMDPARHPDDHASPIFGARRGGPEYSPPEQVQHGHAKQPPPRPPMGSCLARWPH